jgi:hypothetical protein
MDAVKDLVSAIHEAADAARQSGLTVGYSQGVEASQARIAELEHDWALQKSALLHQDRLIAKLESDCLILALRLYGEDPDTLSPEAFEVMDRLRLKCELAIQEAAA